MSDYQIKFKDDSAGKAIDVCVSETSQTSEDYNSTRRFAKAYLDVLARTDISAMDKLIIAVIGMLSQKTGMAFPAVKTIARMVGASILTVERRLAILVGKKEIIKQHRFESNGWQLTNFYSLPESHVTRGGQVEGGSSCGGPNLTPQLDKGQIRQEGTPDKIKKTGTSLRSSPVGAKKTERAKPFPFESKSGQRSSCTDLAGPGAGNRPEPAGRADLAGCVAKSGSGATGSVPVTLAAPGNTPVRTGSLPPAGTSASAIALRTGFTEKLKSLPGRDDAPSLLDWGFAEKRVRENPKALDFLDACLAEHGGARITFGQFTTWLGNNKPHEKARQENEEAQLEKDYEARMEKRQRIGQNYKNIAAALSVRGVVAPELAKMRKDNVEVLYGYCCEDYLNTGNLEAEEIATAYVATFATGESFYSYRLIQVVATLRDQRHKAKKQQTA